MSIKAVLFDLDGTLLDRDTSLLDFISTQYERFPDALGHIVKQQYIERFITLDNNGYTWKDKVYTQLVAEFHIQQLTAEQLLDDYATNFHKHCVPFPHVYRLLQWLIAQNIQLGIITNGFGQFQLNNIRALGIEAYFEAILVSEWEGIKKPNAEIFLRALSKLNIAANKSLFIGDHPINDVAAARAVGMYGIWKRNEQCSEITADFVVDDLLELKNVVNELNEK